MQQDCVSKIIKGVSASEAAALAGNIKEHTKTLVGTSLLGLSQGALGLVNVSKGVYNILDDQMLI